MYGVAAIAFYNNSVLVDLFWSLMLPVREHHPHYPYDYVTKYILMAALFQLSMNILNPENVCITFADTYFNT